MKKINSISKKQSSKKSVETTKNICGICLNIPVGDSNEVRFAAHGTEKCISIGCVKCLTNLMKILQNEKLRQMTRCFGCGAKYST